MKISKAMATLKQIQDKFGDIEITGGCMSDDQPLNSICVTDENGCEIWPDKQGREGAAIDGVFLE